MKIARILPAVVVMVLLVGDQSAVADGWSLRKLLPVSKTETKPKKHYVSRTAKRPPSPLEKLGAETKKFFTKAGEVLRLKKPAPKRKPTNQYIPWIREPKPRWPLQYQNRQKKKSWLSFLFGHKEPKPPQSPREWIGLERLDL